MGSEQSKQSSVVAPATVAQFQHPIELPDGPASQKISLARQNTPVRSEPDRELKHLVAQNDLPNTILQSGTPVQLSPRKLHQDSIFAARDLRKDHCRQTVPASIDAFLPSVARERHLIGRPALTEAEATEPFDAGVLIIDISGFTALTRWLALNVEHGAEELSAAISTYFSEILLIIWRHNGDVYKFAGDALLCLFRGDDARLNMIDAALEAVVELKDRSVLNGHATLSLHASCGHGKVVGMHVGGVEFRGIPRWEWNLHAPALLAKIGTRLKTAEAGDVAMAPDCWTHYRKHRPKVAAVVDSLKAVKQARSDTVVVSGDEDVVADVPRGDGDYEANVSRANACSEALQSYAMRSVVEYFSAVAASGAQNRSVHLINTNRRCSIVFVRLPTSEDLAVAQEISACVETVLRDCNGMLRQYLTDDKGTVAIGVWGCPPLAHKDNAHRAIRFAVNVIDRLRALNHTSVSCGVTTGMCFCGIVGHSLRCDYVVVGDSVNMAARLMAKASDGDVFCDEATALLHRDRTDVAAGQSSIELGKSRLITVKGGGAQKVYPAFIQGTRPTNDPSEAVDATHNTRVRHTEIATMYGRERELETIMNNFQLMESDDSFVASVGIEGSNQMGKTLLITHVCAHCASKFEVVRCSMQDIDRSTEWQALKPLATVLWSFAAALPPSQQEYLPLLLDICDPPPAIPKPLATQVSKALTDIQRSNAISALLRCLLCHATEVQPKCGSWLPGSAPTTSGGNSRTNSSPKQRPFVIVIDNLQFVDRSSLTFIETLLQHHEEGTLRRAALLCSFIPPLKIRRSMGSNMQLKRNPLEYTNVYDQCKLKLVLEPLPPKALGRIVTSIFHQHLQTTGKSNRPSLVPSKALITETASVTGGNLQTVHDIATFWVKNNFLVVKHDNVLGIAKELALPRDLGGTQAWLDTQMDTLPPYARELARAATVLPQTFALRDVQKVADVLGRKTTLIRWKVDTEIRPDTIKAAFALQRRRLWAAPPASAKYPLRRSSRAKPIGGDCTAPTSTMHLTFSDDEIEMFHATPVVMMGVTTGFSQDTQRRLHAAFFELATQRAFSQEECYSHELIARSAGMALFHKAAVTHNIIAASDAIDEGNYSMASRHVLEAHTQVSLLVRQCTMPESPVGGPLRFTSSDEATAPTAADDPTTPTIRPLASTIASAEQLRNIRNVRALGVQDLERINLPTQTAVTLHRIAACVYCEEGNFPQAMESVQRAIELAGEVFPGSLDSHNLDCHLEEQTALVRFHETGQLCSSPVARDENRPMLIETLRAYNLMAKLFRCSTEQAKALLCEQRAFNLGVVVGITPEASEAFCALSAAMKSQMLSARGLRVAASLDDSICETTCRIRLGRASIAEGEWDRARGYLERAVNDAEKMGMAHLKSEAMLHLHWCSFVRGKWQDESLTSLEKAVNQSGSRRLQRQLMLAQSRLKIAELHLAQSLDDCKDFAVNLDSWTFMSNHEKVATMGFSLWSNLQRGNHEGAVAILQKYRDVGPLLLMHGAHQSCFEGHALLLMSLISLASFASHSQTLALTFLQCPSSAEMNAFISAALQCFTSLTDLIPIAQPHDLLLRSQWSAYLEQQSPRDASKASLYLAEAQRSAAKFGVSVVWMDSGSSAPTVQPSPQPRTDLFVQDIICPLPYGRRVHDHFFPSRKPSWQPALFRACTTIVLREIDEVWSPVASKELLDALNLLWGCLESAASAIVLDPKLALWNQFGALESDLAHVILWLCFRRYERDLAITTTQNPNDKSRFSDADARP